MRPEHKCPGCKEIVHTLCGEFDETADCLYCKQCYPCPNVNAVDVDGMNVNAVSVDGIGSPSKEKPPARITCPPSNDCTEVSTTITDGATTDNTATIPYDCFLKKNQRLNNEMKTRDGEKWVELKNDVNNAIDGELKAVSYTHLTLPTMLMV